MKRLRALLPSMCRACRIRPVSSALQMTVNWTGRVCSRRSASRHGHLSHWSVAVDRTFDDMHKLIRSHLILPNVRISCSYW